MYDVMVWAGAVITLIGLGLLVSCILRVARAKSAPDAEEALRKTLEAVVPVNLGGLCLSAIGLMMVVLGLVLGG